MSIPDPDGFGLPLNISEHDNTLSLDIVMEVSSFFPGWLKSELSRISGINMQLVPIDDILQPGMVYQKTNRTG